MFIDITNAVGGYWKWTGNVTVESTGSVLFAE